MSQELGRMERPAAQRFHGKRKLLLVPLLYGPPDAPEEGMGLLQQYWDQVQAQIASLESRLGELRHIYHESLTEGGAEGLKHLESVDRRSHSFVEARCRSGATLEATEDRDALLETLDLQRCLMMPLASEKLARKLHEWFIESNRSRYEKIGGRIDVTLQGDELGLLMINERHQVQFAQDIEVFYVAPPALADFQRWLQRWWVEQQSPSAGEEDSGEQGGQCA